MAEATVFAAEKREKSGKSDARALRKEDKVPAIIYGAGEGEVSIAINRRELKRAYERGGYRSKLVEIDVDGTKIRALPKEIQLDPIKGQPLHADFLRVNSDSRVNVWVPVRAVNAEKSPGIKRGGILNMVRRTVELVCSPDNIPAEIIADVGGMAIGDSLHISAVSLPDGVEPAITDRDFTVAAIVGRAKKEEVATAEVADGAETEEAESED